MNTTILKSEPGLFYESAATFSPCERYRYTLIRQWADGPALNFVMLNPSTADHRQDDATIKRCVSRARSMQFGRLIVTNLFAFRSPHPTALYESLIDPVGGDENNKAIVEMGIQASAIVLAWGDDGTFLERSQQVMGMVRQRFPKKLHVLGWNASGEPKHPLYVALDQPLLAAGA